MFTVLKSDTSAIVIVFLVLIGCLFLCQTLGKLVMYLIGKFKRTSYTGIEVLDYLKAKNKMEDVKTDELPFDWKSSFYSYKKTKNEFVISKLTYKEENLYSDVKAIESVVYANEQKHRSLQFRWQFMGIAGVAALSYIVLIAIMLLTYLPTPTRAWLTDDGSRMILSIGYWMSVEVLCIVGWILVLITLFWWISATQNFEIEMEAQAKKMINDKQFVNSVIGYMNVCAYIPFSFRTVI